MSISKDLFLAILAMDSYNRGYDAGVYGLSSAPGTKLGQASVTQDKGDPVAQAAGF